MIKSLSVEMLIRMFLSMLILTLSFFGCLRTTLVGGMSANNILIHWFHSKFSSVCQDAMYLLRQWWYSQDCLACWANLADLEAPFSPCRYFRWPQDVRPSTVLAINIRNMWKIFHDQACKGYLLFVSKDDTGFRVRPRWPKLVHLTLLDLERWTSVLEGGGLHCGICRLIG